MIEGARHDLLETIHALLVDLRAVMQPHEAAQLHELALDARDATTETQLAEIARQVESLRRFCASRSLSAAGPLDSRPKTRR